jgi:hypothetical protein
MSRNTWAAIAAALAVVAVVTLGFWNLGTPVRERQVHQDVRTVQKLQLLAQSINRSWDSSNKALPSGLERFSTSATQDPTTHAPFIYRPKTSSQYELCATFLTDNRNERQSETPFWLHSKGTYCFQFDASMPLAPPPVSFSY